MNKRIIVWFRQDLRIHDNEALDFALERGEEVIPVYVFDERLFFGKTKYGFQKTGKYRAKFILESIIDLRNSFQNLSSNLVVRIGKPEEEIAKLALEVKANYVYCNRERTYEEIKVQDALEKNLWKGGMELHYFRGKMLYYTQDLPFPVSHSPETFTLFRKEVERFVQVRQPLPSPTRIAPIESPITFGKMPSLADLSYEDFEPDPRAALQFQGGEKAGLARLQEYIWDKDLLKNYRNTRDGLLGGDFSSKLAPWLSQGCLSPKKVYAEIQRYEQQRIKNKSTYHLFFELMWRDFFRLMGKKHKNNIFLEGGIKQEINPELDDDLHRFRIWKEARTGVPFIDANMRELNETGFMSNRGRQNVASFLIHDLKVNWQIGAEYFESLLIDYDPCSNWGNWNYVAGVGNDPREDRYYNILKQAKRYDPCGAYVKHWLHELSEVPNAKVHRPDSLSAEECAEAHFTLGADYPKSIVHPSRWES